MREGLWVLWAMKNKSLTKRTGGRRAVGGVGNEKYESNKNTKREGLWVLQAMKNKGHIKTN